MANYQAQDAQNKKAIRAAEKNHYKNVTLSDKDAHAQFGEVGSTVYLHLQADIKRAKTAAKEDVENDDYVLYGSGLWAAQKFGTFGALVYADELCARVAALRNNQ